MDADTLKSLLECPVCLEVRRDCHIFQCGQGHIVCSVCKTKVQDCCPTCRGEFDEPARRNLQVKKLICMSDFEYPCGNAGCDFVGKGDAIKAHGVGCARREVPCPDCNNNIPAEDVEEHIRSKHVDALWKTSADGDCRRECLLSSDATSKTDWILCVHEFGEEKFALQLSRAEGGTYYAWAQVFGDARAAERYTVEIKVSGNDAEFRKKCKVHPIDKEAQDVKDELDCFRLSADQVRQCQVKNHRKEDAKYTHIIGIGYKLCKTD